MSIVNNRLRIKTQLGSDIYEKLTGIDPATNLGYRFNEYSDINIHIAVATISNPYFNKVLNFDENDPRTLILDLSELELLNGSVVNTMTLQNPPPRFHFYIHGIKDGRRVTLFNGEIHRRSF